MSTIESTLPPGVRLDAERLSGRPESLWRTTIRRLFRRRSAVAGLGLLSILVFMAVFAPLIAPYDPIQVLTGIEQVERRESPCIHLLGCPETRPQHLMGIDGNMRDEFSRIVYGSRFSLIIGFTTVGFSIVIGTVLGAVAGYFGGWLDNVIMRIMDVVLAFPALLLAIVIASGGQAQMRLPEGKEYTKSIRLE